MEDHITSLNVFVQYPYFLKTNNWTIYHIQITDLDSVSMFACTLKKSMSH